MPQDPQTKEIDDLEFTIVPLDPFKANRLLLDLGEALGFAGGELKFGNIQKGVLNANVDGGSVARSIGELCHRIPRERFEKMVKDIGVLTTVKGHGLLDKQAKIDELFRGRLWTLYKWIAFALEVNYQDFFDGIISVTGVDPQKALASIGSGPPKPSDESGGSGD